MFNLIKKFNRKDTEVISKLTDRIQERMTADEIAVSHSIQIMLVCRKEKIKDPIAYFDQIMDKMTLEKDGEQ